MDKTWSLSEIPSSTFYYHLSPFSKIPSVMISSCPLDCQFLRGWWVACQGHCARYSSTGLCMWSCLNNIKGKPFKIMMLPLIHSAHIYWCIYCDELCKRLCLTIPHFGSFFPLVSLADQWTRAHLEKGIVQLKASLAQGEGALVLYAISCLCLHHFRNICLPENSLHTLPSNFKLFFC